METQDERPSERRPA
jgi:hypothetical protein